MDYSHTPPRFVTDRHRGKDQLQPRPVRPMTSARDAAASRATTYGANAAPPHNAARGTTNRAKTKGRY